MSKQFDPPRYEWTASTIEEAQSILGAAGDLIDAHVSTLAPAGSMERLGARRTTPARLVVSLDLSGAVDRINDQRAAADHG
jgi:hypothetical protein